MKNIAVLCLLAVKILYAQNPVVSIATWKNNAAGAYNIIHDDFGDYVVSGIQNYADTMHYNRGLKFTFGAITVSCENNPGMYAKATSMINDHGHEIINHSHSHTCAIRDGDWCTTGLWAQPATENFDQEIDHSTTSIFNGTGVRPRYFIYPFDLYNEAANAHLKTVGYIGARTGTKELAEQASLNHDAEGFFRTAFVVDAPTIGGVTKAINLNQWVDHAIANNTWVNRELHNVGSSGWGHVTVAEYRTHLNYLKQKVNSGELWVGTVSEILTYQMQKKNYTPTSSYNPTSQEITISWNTPTFNVATWLSPLVYKSPITLLVDMSAHPGVYTVYQNNVEITDVTRVGNELRINVYPHNGPVKLSAQGCPGICISQQPSSLSVNEDEPFSFTIAATTQIGTLTYQWYLNDNLIAGATGPTYSIDNATAADAGTYHVIVGKTGSPDQVQSGDATLTVVTQGPFASRISLPGKIEAENFDNGGQGISWNETTPLNQGNAPGYRTSSVDVENCADGGYDVGYITAGEWLEYSVAIAAESDYDFTFRIASNGGTIPTVQVLLDGSSLIPATNMALTGGWQIWQSVSINDVHLPAGNHVLRIVFPTGNMNINYVNVSGGTLGMFTKKSDSWFTIYPNPASDKLTLEHFLSNQSNVNIKIYDLQGKEILRQSIQQVLTEISVSELPRGTYLVELHDGMVGVQKKITLY